MFANTNAKMWRFAFAVTCLKLLVVGVLNFLIFPFEILALTIAGTSAIIVAVSMPTCLWVAAQVQQKSVLNRKLQVKVNRDGLTDVATRDYFFERLARDEHATGVTLMVDIDHFKGVNDTHGHLVGDEVLRVVAKELKAQVRYLDIVCRFGGEEFVVFLSQASLNDGWIIADRIRSAIETMRIPTASGDIAVTVSIGGSPKTAAEHIDKALGRADKCLYGAKALGRNRTVVDWDDTHNAPFADAAPDTISVVQRPHPADATQSRSALPLVS